MLRSFLGVLMTTLELIRQTELLRDFCQVIPEFPKGLKVEALKEKLTSELERCMDQAQWCEESEVGKWNRSTEKIGRIIQVIESIEIVLRLREHVSPPVERPDKTPLPA